MILNQEILDLDDPQQVVEALVTDGKPGMGALDDFAADLVRRVGLVDPDDIVARRHQGTSTTIAEAKHTLDHLVLAFLEHTGLGALLQQDRDLFLSDRRLGPGTDAQHLQHAIRRSAQDANQRGQQCPRASERGRESTRAIRSGRTSAIRLGTSSANTIDAAVIASTITPTPERLSVRGERTEVFNRMDQARGHRQTGEHACQSAQQRRASLNCPEQRL